MKKEKGFIHMILIVVVALIVVGAGVYYLFTLKRNAGSAMPVNNDIASQYQVDYQEGATNAPSVNSGNDLDKVMAQLDGTDLNQIDKQLDSISADVSGF
jgi:flagellar basal body-associated protein FliL